MPACPVCGFPGVFNGDGSCPACLAPEVDAEFKREAMLARLRGEEGRYRSPRPTVSTRTVGRTPGRNEPCPCGSGRKFKRCCA